MAITMYTMSVPVFQHMLRNLLHILDKAERHSATRKIDPAALTTFRLFPDMMPFARHVHIACSEACMGVSRICGMEAPRSDDKEASFPELKERVGKALSYLCEVPAAAMEVTEDSDVTFMVRGALRTMKAEAYLKTWVMANFFFHITTAYAILRHNGVELGKLDYLDGKLASG
jgi:uncharacterized protein